MFPLFETICVEDGKILCLDYHQRRYKTAYSQYWSKQPSTPLADGFALPHNCKTGKYKLKVSYNKHFQHIEIEPYTFKHIERLKIVSADTIDYSLKYTDRKAFADLLLQRHNCHDVLIIKNGMVTDSSFCNIVFFDGKKWLTPSTPLLQGTARARLLEQGHIKEIEIGVEDIKRFRSFRLINAMRHFYELKPTAIEGIVF
ncbi:hypothetical protein HW49_02150 [Porphyromonadaceae bacterium COT-184 OH4590]|nr:hypothetical protein HW49_02150 [Porphyromonadaceae bacterium COT-184 OH4590]